MTEQNESMNLDAGEEIMLDDTGGAEDVSPPSLKTTDFQFPIGDEIPLPDEDDLPMPISDIERVIAESNFMPAWFLERGAQVQRAVARVVLTKPHVVRGHTFQPGTGWATGFMVSPTLFMTNNHVIPEKDFADKVRAQFNYQLSPQGMEQITESFFSDADDVFHTNPALDYTLVRLRPLSDTDGTVLPGERWGFIALNDSPIFRNKQRFNIVQHPRGRRKEVALQDNEIDRLFTKVVRYRADTEPGSSGSPVFNNLWELVALHHAGGDRDDEGVWLNNEGIRIDAVIADLRDHFADRVDVLDELGI